MSCSISLVSIHLHFRWPRILCMPFIMVMASWHHGNMASWHHGIMASWHHGIMASWHHGIMASWHHGIMAPWHHGIMASWHHSIILVYLLQSQGHIWFDWSPGRVSLWLEQVHWHGGQRFKADKISYESSYGRSGGWILNQNTIMLVPLIDGKIGNFHRPVGR